MNNLFKTLLTYGRYGRTLYYHRIYDGAEYLSDTFTECKDEHKEGTMVDETKVLLRVDGGELEIIRIVL